MGLQFFPRGGSAQVVRYLAQALRTAGWGSTVVTGSLGAPGEDTHAGTFFAGLDPVAVDYQPAVEAFARGEAPAPDAMPVHASYEDRPGVADCLLAAVAPDRAPAFTDPWRAAFADGGADRADVAHLHHLTPQFDAVAQRWPDLTRVVHLHGTEVKFLQALDARRAVVAALGHTLGSMAWAASAGSLDTALLDTAPLDPAQRELVATTRWDQWRHGEHWRRRLVSQARHADHLITVSEPDRATAMDLFGVGPDRITAITNGVQTDRFRPEAIGRQERRARFRRWLVEDPQGWDRTGRPGAVAYGEHDLDRLLGPDGTNPVLIYVGRFTAAKRVPLLVRAFAEARARALRPISLLIWGGHPGEWEGEHPVDVAAEVGGEGIYFAGWRGHQDLPAGLTATDALIMPSVNDSFAQTALEAMAVGQPVVATLSGGFPTMINLDPQRPTGWLVPPDDPVALADLLVELASDPAQLRRRGRFALDHAQADLSWDGKVAAFEDVYAQAVHRRQRARTA